MDHTKKELTCNQTRNVRTAFVSYSELNDKDTLFGGEIMSHFDSACGRAVFNFVKRPSFTATVDLVAFIQPVRKNEAIYVEAYVSGCGNTSVEAFAKLTATDVRSGESRICAYAFLPWCIHRLALPSPEATLKYPLFTLQTSLSTLEGGS